MADALLTLNAGSSSLKFALFLATTSPTLELRGRVTAVQDSAVFRAFDGSGRPVDERSWPGNNPPGHAGAAAFVLEWLGTCGLPPRDLRLIAIGHRVVHGGERFSTPMVVDGGTLESLDALTPLAPLHQPQSLAAIRTIIALAPTLPQVACFDTAFHRTQPPVAQMCAIPRMYAGRGIRRYGFHGLSYESIAGRLGDVDAPAASGRTIVAHLGAGASLCAMHNRASIATTMGFSALDGLVMSTRCGSIDPGVLIHLQRHHGLSVDQLEQLLYHESGLLGVSGLSGDMRTLLDSDRTEAAEATHLFEYRISREIGSLVAALGGLDGLVFTGGIGENSPEIREAVCLACGWAGVDIDRSANAAGRCRISADRSRVRAYVIPTDEELMIARHTMRIVHGRGTEPIAGGGVAAQNGDPHGE